MRERLIALVAVACGLWTAEACTGFYVGKNVSTDGSIILGRTIDMGMSPGGSRVVIVPRVENVPERVYRRTRGDAEFAWPLPATTYRYVMTPMSSGYLCGEWSSCCVNEKGLGITGTVTGATRRPVRAAFPYEKNGMAEYNYPALVAATCATAREAVELTGRVMAKLGTKEPNIYMVADQKEAWLVETYAGRLWAAHRLPDDFAGGFGNHFVLGAYDPDSDEWAATPDIVRLLREKGLAVFENGRLHLEKSIGGSRTQFCDIRSWFAKRLIAPGTEGEYRTKRPFECFYPPSRKLGPDDVAMFTRYRYAGTDWDPDANDRNDVRVIGTESTMSAHVIQVRPDLPAERAATAWVALGPAEHTPYLPVANCATRVDEAYSRDHADANECSVRYYPELYAADAYRRLCGLSAQNRERYGNAVRDYWAKRERELFAKWPAVLAGGDVRAIDAFTVREQRRALADANRMAAELEMAMTFNARKLVQMQREGVYAFHTPAWVYEPSDVNAARTAQHRCDPEVTVASNACKAVVAAADEFRKYWQQVTDRPVAKISEWRVAFEVDAQLDAAHDEYRIVSDDKGVRFVGANGRAVLYAVYDFYERQAGCRWFWDGDKVPKRETIGLGGLDVREKARLERRGLRHVPHRGLTRFQAGQWVHEDWKAEIDWMLKSRLNVLVTELDEASARYAADRGLTVASDAGADCVYASELSHADDFLMRCFTDGAWGTGQAPDRLLSEFCHDRYGKNAAKFEEAWKRVRPISSILGWRGDWGMEPVGKGYLDGRDYEKDRETLEAGPEALGILASIEPGDEFQRRDVIDLARTVIEASAAFARHRLQRDYAGWCAGTVAAAEVRRSAKAYLKLVDAATEILALHADYSLDESYDRLCRDSDAVAPDVRKAMLAEAIDGPSRLYPYEIAAGWYRPMARQVVAEFLRKVAAGDRTEVPEAFLARVRQATRDEMVAQGFGAFRPTLPRLRRECLRVLGDAREAAAR